MLRPRALSSAFVLAALACTGCGERDSPAPATPDTATPSTIAEPDAPAPALQWRGPNRYDLRLGELTVGAGLKVPGAPWTERYAGARAQLESPAGSALTLTLEPGAVREPARSGHHEHAVGAAAPHRVVCAFSLAPEEAGLLDALTRECAELSIEFEPDPRVSWAIELEPAVVSMAQRDELSIRYRVTNDGDATLDASAYGLQWKLDGEDSMVLGMAFGNGLRDGRWAALPPGASVDDRRVGLELADAPGEYTITLHHLDHEVARATLKVTP
ncbi:hypothetical protein PPSIR1_22731 [Plesiocystis pacifica SIR-1]|uniref:Lipoprotein n=1 Tax=Plesiocystis pacifica SIR-1 TaxID=391625 RepID=A6G2G9_9BACT|nr:hypothetical protein [Plesiocystis pacifica]EDM79906.1 hypothetical protein PPSIR1_22731 [Plesiocystis pacifica SIR-1]